MERGLSWILSYAYPEIQKPTPESQPLSPLIHGERGAKHVER
jgi:hypothetical protein